MTILFKFKTKGPAPSINTAVFLYNDVEVTIDRETTYYSTKQIGSAFDKDGVALECSMKWYDIYALSHGISDHNIPEDFADKAKFECFHIEDLTSEYYPIYDVECTIGKE